MYAVCVQSVKQKNKEKTFNTFNVLFMCMQQLEDYLEILHSCNPSLTFSFSRDIWKPVIASAMRGAVLPCWLRFEGASECLGFEAKDI